MARWGMLRALSNRDNSAIGVGFIEEVWSSGRLQGLHDLFHQGWHIVVATTEHGHNLRTQKLIGGQGCMW